MNKKAEVRAVIKEGEEPQPIEILQSSIVDIARAMKKITTSRLKPAAIVTLIARETGVGRGEIEKVMSCLDELENLFLKPKKQ